jgi:hypothetical protein
MNIQSLFELALAPGFWRLHHAFTARSTPVTVYGVAMGAGAQPADGRRNARRRLGDRDSWLSLDRGDAVEIDLVEPDAMPPCRPRPEEPETVDIVEGGAAAAPIGGQPE